MKITLATLILLAAVEAAAFPSGYGYGNSITVNHAQVPNTDQTNFPVLVCFNLTLGNGNTCPTLTAVKTVANSGNIQNTVSFNGQTVPADLIFTSDSAGSSLLSWDVASYSASSGLLEVYVKVATVATAADTTIYMWYGNSSVTTYQGGSVGAAYDANFKGVWHFTEASGTTNVDSSSGGNTATKNSSGHPASATGQVNLGNTYGGSPDVSQLAGAMDYYPITFGAWIKTSNSTVGYAAVISEYVSGSLSGFMLHAHSDGHARFWYFKDASNYVYDGGNGWDCGTVNNNAWRHVVVTIASGGGTCYLDGVAGTTHAWTGTAAATTQSRIVEFGADNGGFYYPGSIEEARISNSARSADWIKTEFNNQSAPSTFLTIGTQMTPNASHGFPLVVADARSGFDAGVPKPSISAIGQSVRAPAGKLFYDHS